MKKVVRTFAYLLGLVALLALGGAQWAAAQGAQNRAGLVVQFGDSTVRTYCIAFTGESISGLDLLFRSGLDVITEEYGSMGGQVCKIEGEGCDYPGEVCACKSYGPQGVYWSYHHLRGGVWKSSALGGGSYRVRNGEVDGWAWSSGKPPVVRTFEQICSVAQPQLTSTPRLPTSTPRPQPTNTPRPPSATPTPSQRPQPTHTPRPHTATPQPAKPSNTAMATATKRTATPTSIAVKPQPTSTKQPQVIRPSPSKTAIRQATATRQTPNVLLPTPSATPTEIEVVVIIPSEQPAEATPTSVTIRATSTQTAAPVMEVITPTSTATHTPALAETKTPVVLPATNLPLPKPGTQPPAADTARTVSIVIGATVAAGLLVWGGVKLASRRGATDRQRGGPRAG